MCGVCPTCVMSPKSPGCSQRLWKVSDDFQRRFVLQLVSRSRDTRVLESVQATLSVTSLTLFNYSRSKRPVHHQDYPRRELDVEPLCMDVSEIWEWFDGSSHWVKTRYLSSLLALCDPELLRTVADLTNVLLVRQKRGSLQSKVSSCSTIHPGQDSHEVSEDPALMAEPEPSGSLPGVSRYRDFIGCLPVNLSKRILGVLDEPTLRRCQKVSLCWQHLSQETLEELHFRRLLLNQNKAMMKRCRGGNIVNPTYASIVEVAVPVKDEEDEEEEEEEEEEDIHASVKKVRPFEAAYAKIKTKLVPMEERNVYCGAYFTTVLLDKEDRYRVVDYRGGSLMAVGSKDCKVRLLHVASDVTETSVMQGHVGSIRAILLCRDMGLVMTGSCDASIRCWDLKTDACVMTLYGHSATVTSLDVHADRLVSGAKDCLVKVWCLLTGEQFEDFNFRHPSPVQCVRIGATMVYSSCERGLVRIWDMENASLLRVIDAHSSSVKCLYLDEWHLLSGDSGGQVMAWSVSCDAKECLRTFSHPKAVKSLTLVYLRVVTACADGKIRIFNFLTGDCLRDIKVAAEIGRIKSLHVDDSSIIVNAKRSVTCFQFAKVFWDYEGQGAVCDKSAASVGERPAARSASPGRHTRDPDNEKPQRAEQLHCTRLRSSSAKCHAEARLLVIQSQRAASERVKRRVPHHPLSRDSTHLRVNAIQRARCTDEASVNAERGARPRVSWGPRASQDPLQPDLQAQHARSEAQLRKGKTRSPALKRAANQNITSTKQDRARKPHSAPAHRAISATEGPQAPDCTLMRLLPRPECSGNSSAVPRISPVDPLREQARLGLSTVAQMEEMEICKQKLSKRKI